MAFSGIPAEASVSDELIGYLDDELRWVASLNPAASALPGVGLNRYGVTVVEASGCQALARLLERLVAVFELAPETFELTTGYDLDGQRFERMTFIRSSVLEQLCLLRNLARTVGREGLALLHLGI